MNNKHRTSGSSNHLKLEYIIKHNTIIQTIYRVLISALFKFVGLFIPIDDKLVLMNGHGYKYNDSPKAIFERMEELGLTKTYSVIWALKNPEDYSIPNCKIVKMDTVQYFFYALKAKYWISCVNIERALRFKKKNQVYLNTWHGAAINICGNGVNGRHDFRWDYIDYFCVCSKYDEACFGKDLMLNPDSFLRSGLPRNDSLYYCTPEKINSIKKQLKLPLEKKCILYAPTWRDSIDGGESFQIAPPINWHVWKEKLRDEYVILLRTHPYTTKLMNVEFDDFVLDFTNYPNVNDLLIASDILISDYSSIILDYCITEKPIICFGYDYDEYKLNRGFYYDLEDEMPNGVQKKEEEVLELLTNMDFESNSKKTTVFKRNHCNYGNGNATNECINALFGTAY